ncbi:MAG: hypothetical protein BSOLF_2911 [Candidatus Carbobacillus altaicus]|uniref:Uncharacterized protein n=1 Tax=Candidatus Carbonibacillus altaicus TaxID=2163959 RepID=A0A2R6XXR0_9BACL|nr:MAG: hypothetical protein BSOLF_2911 [Candidatus Carbobacillus altaicus]
MDLVKIVHVLLLLFFKQKSQKNISSWLFGFHFGFILIDLF